MKPHMKTAEQVDGFTSLQVSEMTGATLRQLQWWDERLVVQPKSWRGNRVYSAKQVEIIGRMVQLRRAGVSLQNLRKGGTIGLRWKSVVVSRNPVVVVGDTLVVFQGRAR